MRNGKGIHEQICDFKACAGFKQVAIEPGLQLEFKRFFCGAVTVNRDVQFLGNADQAGNMVTVFMCDENGGEIFGRTTNTCKALADLARAKAGVHKNAGLVSFKIGAITA